MAERTGVTAMKGNPLTLVGNEVKVGSKAPDVTLVANDLSEVGLSSFFNQGKKVIISVVPSLDTGICDLQTKRFNQEASKNKDVIVLTISKDLPFAQKRWCGATGATAVKTLSDFRGNFGETYGVLIKGLGLLARAIFVVDENGKVVYTQWVKEVTTEPNYDEVMASVTGAAMSGKASGKDACGCGHDH